MSTLERVITAVREVAHQEIIPRYLQVERIYKADGSFYTEADLAAQKVCWRDYMKLPRLQ